MQDVFDQQTIAQLGRVSERHGIRLVVLFGSQAMGTAGEQSDIDIGVLFSEAAYSPSRELDFGSAVMNLLQTGHVDVAVLNHAEPLLLKEVATNGLPLYEAERGLFDEYQVLFIKKYFETAKFRSLAAENLEYFLKAKGA